MITYLYKVLNLTRILLYVSTEWLQNGERKEILFYYAVELHYIFIYSHDSTDICKFGQPHYHSKYLLNPTELNAISNPIPNSDTFWPMTKYQLWSEIQQWLCTDIWQWQSVHHHQPPSTHTRKLTNTSFFVNSLSPPSLLAGGALWSCSIQIQASAPGWWWSQYRISRWWCSRWKSY